MSKELNNAAAGGLAGIAGGLALGGAAQIIYNLTSPAAIEKEQKIEPRHPFIVLAQKLETLAGREKSDYLEKVLEATVITVTSVLTGALYSSVEKKLPGNWLAGAVLFGTTFWLVDDEGLGSAMGLVGDNKKYPAEAHVRGLLAHIVFGVVTAAVYRSFTKGL